MTTGGVEEHQQSSPLKELCVDLLGKRTQSGEAHGLLLTRHRRGKQNNTLSPVWR